MNIAYRTAYWYRGNLVPTLAALVYQFSVFTVVGFFPLKFGLA